jgi:hypothetical protein
MPRRTNTVGATARRQSPVDDTSAERRFGSHVKIHPSGCWAFNGDLATYGQFVAGRTIDTKVKAHRFAYETLVGPIPDGCEIHHLCCNPGCVNPAHLAAMTHAEHMVLHAEIQRSAA